jgi:hypothetical protein
MATVKNNVVTQGLSGKLGNQIVFRAGKGGRTIVAVRPAANGAGFNEIQLEHQEAFRNAILYARSAKDKPIYMGKAQGTTMNSFNAAVADWFHEPEVLEIDISTWTGAIGQVIRVKAQDDTHVASVRLAITNGNGTTFEQGQAVQADGLWWEYTTTAEVSLASNPAVIATVEDLPGHTDQKIWQNT